MSSSVFKMATVGPSWLKLAQLGAGMSCCKCSEQSDRTVSNQNWEYLNICHLSAILDFCQKKTHIPPGDDTPSRDDTPLSRDNTTPPPSRDNTPTI